MTPFTTVSGVAAALPQGNIDTDIIFPARFLLITARDGLGRYAFHDWRFASDGSEIPGFVFNREPFRDAAIIVAGDNFGSGSSREQAVWALLGRGTRCIIAPGFGEIFHANCLRNGILPVTLSNEVVAPLLEAAEEGRRFSVDLVAQTLDVPDFAPIKFSIAPERKLALQNGWDETSQIIHQHGPAVTAFEARQRQTQPWLWERQA
jgi:3-isopropylmalate/(R)-2-methylmalate dehydratase small subunit